MLTKYEPTDDPWYSLKAYTPARIALGRTGHSLPLKHLLEFRMAHAHARDAVYTPMDTHLLMDAFQAEGYASVSLQTLATNRSLYLQQPHLGKSLASSSIDTLLPCQNEPCTIALVVADGLSATAIHEHALPMMQLLLPQLQKLKYSYSPICLVEQGRVAIGDPIGQLLKSSLSLVFIGERPGLSSPNSMGIYLTYQPRIGNTDEKRNCISNIRPNGLPYAQAIHQLIYLIQSSLQLQLSGVGLKDESGNNLIGL